MQARTNLSIKVFLMLLLSVLVACNEAIPRRSTISPGQLTEEPEECPEGYHEETIKEKDEETGEEIDVVQCVEDAKVRPSNAVIFKTDFCGCLDGKAVTYGNCTSFCAGRDTKKTETFFANFTVTPDISLSGLGSVYGWCNTVLPGEQANPKCQLEAKSEDGSVTMLDVTINPDSNSLTSPITGLNLDKTYVMTLVETISKVRSNSVQIIKFSADIGIPVLGPLKNAPITQYTCVIREGGNNDIGDIFYDYSYRMHFYFLPRRPPSPIPPGTNNIACHDIFNPLYGITDDVLYPRLESVPGTFNLWDTNDPRFHDNNGNTTMDVNDIIVQKTRNFGGTIPAASNFFFAFTWMNEPNIGNESDGSGGSSLNSMPLGYMMAPWIDSTTFKSYCLNSTHYNSNNALYKALRDVLGVDTEAIYVGEKAQEVVTTGAGTPTNGFKDFILIRETDLKQVWFYLENGVPTAPTDANVANVPVFFYYPLNKQSPFIKSSTQRIYQVKGMSELPSSNKPSGTGVGDSGAATSYPPHDRRVGCVPKF